MNQQAPKYAFSSSESEDRTNPDLLPSLVKLAQTLARPHVSNRPVGAAGLLSDGRIFLGANVEFPGLPLHNNIHAEQFLLANIAAHHTTLVHAAVPSGHRLQLLQQVQDANGTQILVVTDPPPLAVNSQLQLDDAAVLAASAAREAHALRCDCGADHATCAYMAMNNFAFEEHTLATARKDWLSDVRNEFHGLIASSEKALMWEALEAARGSHAPYSGCPSGVAVLDCDGRAYRGSYVESVAACHLSLMPVQAALVSYMVGGGGGFERIVAAVLVEKEDAVVAQEETARLILNHISPKCEILVVHCR